MRLILPLTAMGTVLAAPAIAHAQDSTPVASSGQDAAEDGDGASATLPPVSGDVIIVQSTRLRGQLDVEQPPVATFEEADIAAFGASSIADIIDAIQPSTSSGARGSRGGGQPVFLLNGIRVSSFREFRSYPPEAVLKVEVFSEEVAQRYGYSANQRVVNIILKDDFKAVTAEAEYEQPDRGGYSRNEQEATFLSIGEKGRLNFNAQVEDTSMLTEAERGLTVADAPGEAEYRSLIADSMSAEATANYARGFEGSGASLGLNATVNHDESRSLSGLADNLTDPLERRSETNSLSLGLSLNKPMGDWNATFTSDGVYARGTTEIDRRDGTGFDTADTTTTTITNKATLVGRPISLPAGDVAVTFDAGLDWKNYKSEDTRTDGETEVTRRRLRAGTNISIPVAERDGAWGAIGSLTLNVGGGIEDLSDFGTLKSWTAGATWSPFENFTLTATRIWNQEAPSISDLGNPQIAEYNVPVYDYARGENALVTLITGGNPDLAAETQADWKFGANWQLPFWDDARLQVDYGINTSRNVTATPAYTAAFEEAFPDRVSRDANGALLAIDRRPVTLYQTRSRILSFGIAARGAIGKEPEGSTGGGGRRGGMGGPGGAGPGMGGPAGPGGASGAAPGGFGGMFDPARMAAMREAFCKVPEGQMPDLSTLPEQVRSRLLGADGQPDPEKVAQMRARFCGEDGAQMAERFAELRTKLCAEPPVLEGIPDEMLARLKREDGSIDPEKLAQFRTRMCAAPGAGGSETAAPAGGGRRGGGRGFGPMGGGDSNDTRPRYFFSFNNNVTFENTVLLAAGGPLLDQLDGEALGSGAVPRYTARLEGGLFWKGYGFRLGGQYTGKARIDGGNLPGASDLYFGDIATFDIRLFADLGEALKKDSGWAKGLRISLVADNVFDARRSVVDEDGVTPEAYAPYRLDPTGRYLGIDVRKAF